MNTAIIYTSKHGTTAKVAKMIAERLMGSQVSVIDLNKDEHPNISSFEGVILGTSVYAGTPSKTMQRFCKNNSEILTQKRLALFVCGMEQDTAANSSKNWRMPIRRNCFFMRFQHVLSAANFSSRK